MSIFHRILFAGDFSRQSRGAFDAACAMAGESGAHLHILNVVEPVLVAEPPGPGGARLPAVLPADTPPHRKEIEGQLRTFYRANLPVTADYLVRHGNAPDEILRAAKELDSDLIVVGKHGRGGVDRLVCGSVAESVMRRSSRPVLVARDGEESRSGAPIRMILHPTDFSAHSWPALGVARALARAHHAGLALMHVAPADVLAGGSFYAPAELGPEREELAKLEQQAAAGLEGRVKARFRQGDPVTEILLAAEELGCDLIVMGSHGRTGLRRLMMGSVAESVCRRAPCLTLIVKDAPDEETDAVHEPSLAGHAGASG